MKDIFKTVNDTTQIHPQDHFSLQSTSTITTVSFGLLYKLQWTAKNNHDYLPASLVDLECPWSDQSDGSAGKTSPAAFDAANQNHENGLQFDVFSQWGFHCILDAWLDISAAVNLRTNHQSPIKRKHFEESIADVHWRVKDAVPSWGRRKKEWKSTIEIRTSTTTLLYYRSHSWFFWYRIS